MVKLRDLKDVEYRTVDQKQLYLKGEHTETLEALVATFFPDGKNKTPRQYGGHNILLQGETGTGKTFVVGMFPASCLYPTLV
jgi:Cdc6-like AAA superfamily ATPase